LNPGVTENSATVVHDQYTHRKSETAIAKAKVRDKADALQVIELDR
jgi:hypothetical protein